MQLIHHTKQQQTPIRVVDYIPGIFPQLPTKSSVKKAISKGQIYVDGKLVSTAVFIIGGEQIKLLQQPSRQIHKTLNLTLKVVFEDNFLAIVVKPAGILVNGNSYRTIDNALVQNLTHSSEIDGCRPRPVHRLDFPTSGLLLIGKTTSSIIALNKLFENSLVKKTYVAVTEGHKTTSGTINIPIDGKQAISEYKTLHSISSKHSTYLNLMCLFPKTGRRHQLRKHLSANDTPILGDLEYGKENKTRGKGLYLHAHRLEFTHPFTNATINSKDDVPKKFKKLFHLFPFN